MLTSAIKIGNDSGLIICMANKPMPINITLVFIVMLVFMHIAIFCQNTPKSLTSTLKFDIIIVVKSKQILCKNTT